MHLDDDIVRNFSPNRFVKDLSCQLALAVGEKESDEFRRQSVEFAAAADLRLHVAPNCDHFEVSFTLAEPQGLVAQLAMAQIQNTL